MFMSFGKSLGFGEIEGFDIYKCACAGGKQSLKMWQLFAKLKFTLTDP